MNKIITCALLLCSGFAYTQVAPAETQPPKYFDGIYFGLNGGTQNIFGGSFVNNMDVLAQDSRFVAELLAGFRKQFLKNRLVAGAEFEVGFTDGNLTHIDEVQSLKIDYKNSSQSGKGITIGYIIGARRNFLFFGYLNETKRSFSVNIQQPGARFSQTDKQGMLKYGIGAEVNVFKKLNLRSTFGAMRVDFGNQQTNIDVEDKYDFTLGIVYQF